jgi:hypothetical protein
MGLRPLCILRNNNLPGQSFNFIKPFANKNIDPPHKFLWRVISGRDLTKRVFPCCSDRYIHQLFWQCKNQRPPKSGVFYFSSCAVNLNKTSGFKSVDVMGSTPGKQPHCANQRACCVVILKLYRGFNTVFVHHTAANNQGQHGRLNASYRDQVVTRKQLGNGPRHIFTD